MLNKQMGMSGMRIDLVDILNQKLCNPNWNISENLFEIINIGSNLFHEYGDDSLFVQDFIYMILFRLYRDYPHVFAITEGQFPGYDGLESFWENEGFKDIYGFTWLRKRERS